MHLGSKVGTGGWGRWGRSEDGVMEQGRRQSLGFYGFAQRGARRADNTDRTLLLRVIVATMWGTLQRGQIPKKSATGLETKRAITRTIIFDGVSIYR